MLLSDGIDHYLADRLAKGYARKTIKSEESALRRFLAITGNIQVHNVTPRHVDDYWFRHPHWAPGTANLKKAHLKAFFKWCAIRGYGPKQDPLEGVRDRKREPRHFQIVPQDRFEELLDAAPLPRDRIIVALGLYLFLRVSETANLRWRDIDFKAKTVKVTRIKTRQADVLPMCEELEEELKRWRLAYGAEAGQVPRPEWFVCPAYSRPKFVNLPGERGRLTMVKPGVLMPAVQHKSITERVKVVLRKCGLDAEREGGHTLRRSGATALYRELAAVGHDRAIRMCQAMLGHASISTTEVYLALDLDRKVRNDLLSGKRMFRARTKGQVVELERRADEG